MKQISGEHEIIQILEDIGYNEDEICRLMESLSHPERFLTLLLRRRAALLDEIHHGEKKIDCLDYLIFQMKHHTSNCK